MPKPDLDLLKEADGFDCWYSDYEKKALDDMLKQVERGMPLSPNQRRWAENLITQLEERPERREDDD